MPKVDLYKTDGTKVGKKITLSDEIFAHEVNVAAIHQVVVAQQNNARQGTQSTLTRAEVRGGGIKPWRQKGTGRARHGSIRSPQWTGGGVVFAPKPRSYRQDVNKKVRRVALKSALSQQVNNLIVLENLEVEPKTKEIAQILKNLEVSKRALIILNSADDSAVIAARNIPNVKTIQADALNVYDVVNCQNIIATQDAIKKIEEVYSK